MLHISIFIKCKPKQFMVLKVRIGYPWSMTRRGHKGACGVFSKTFDNFLSPSELTELQDPALSNPPTPAISVFIYYSPGSLLKFLWKLQPCFNIKAFCLIAAMPGKFFSQILGCLIFSPFPRLCSNVSSSERTSPIIKSCLVFNLPYF